MCLHTCVQGSPYQERSEDGSLTRSLSRVEGSFVDFTLGDRAVGMVEKGTSRRVQTVKEDWGKKKEEGEGPLQS